MKKNNTITRFLLILAGIFLSLIIVEMGMRVTGYFYNAVKESRNREAIKKKSDFTVLCIGESTTAGVRMRDESYPAFLEKILNENMPDTVFSVINKGITAGDSTMLLSHLQENIDKYSPDAVAAMMGINESLNYMQKRPPVNKMHSFLLSLRIVKLAGFIKLHLKSKYSQEKEKDDIIEYKDDKVQIEPENTADSTVKNKDNEGSALKNNFLRQGYYYKDNKEYDKAVEMYVKTIGSDRESDYIAFHEMREIFNMTDNVDKYENILKELIILNPENIGAYFFLADVYSKTSKIEQEKAVLDKAEAVFSDNPEVYSRLGEFFVRQKKFKEAGKNIIKSWEMDKKNKNTIESVRVLCQRLGDYELYEKVINEAIDQGVDEEWCLRNLLAIYIRQKNWSKADDTAKRITGLEVMNYNELLTKNYLKLKSILDDNGIRLICVQYPVRNIRPLKDILKEYDDIIYVDNEKLFKDAIKKEGFAYYFNDMFGGDFGHCTREGDMLLAGNVAKTILKEFYGKDISITNGVKDDQ